VNRGRNPVITAIVAILMGGCAGTPGGSPAESLAPSAAVSPATGVPTLTPAPGPTPAVSIDRTSAPATGAPTPQTSNLFAIADVSVLARQRAVRVAVDRLNLRGDASTTGHVTATARRGDVLLLGAIGITAEGYTWRRAWPVTTLPTLPEAIDWPPASWVAVESTTGPYVTEMAPRCPSRVDLANVAAMLPAERSACFAATSVELEGTVICRDCGGVIPGIFEPYWLAHQFSDPLLATGDDRLTLYWSGGDAPPTGQIVRVRGHFNDPLSAICEMAYELEGGFVAALAASDATAVCRARFVVDSFDVLGPDPSWHGV